MTTNVGLVLGRVPDDTDFVLVIWAKDADRIGTCWLGLSDEEVVKTLYRVADNVVEQRLGPVPKGSN